MLYQLAICDFRKPLAPGWEAEIQDPLLREDIADAACGDPAKRLNSAADLVERLLTLEQRRIQRDELILLGKLDEASTLLRQINVPALVQLTGDPDWGANATLAQAEIAYRRGNYDAARSYVQTVTPVFTRKDAEPYQKRALESLRAALDKPLPRKLPN